MTRPVVTVMIPSYNYERYLTECVETALDQPGVDVDVALIDNASTDDSLALARRLAAADERIRLVTYPDNQGIMCSLNRCYAEIRGDYAVLLCADDRLVPGSLARVVEHMEANPGVGLAFGPAIDFTEIGDVDPACYTVPPGAPIVYPGADWIAERCRTGTNPIRTPEAVLRASAVAKVGHLDPSIPHTSDLNMWLRLASVSDVSFLPGPPVALYRRHGANHSNAFVMSHRHDLEARMAAFDRFFATVPDRPERAGWEREVRKVLAGDARYVASRLFVQGNAPDGAVDDLLALAGELAPGATPVADRLGWSIRRTLGPKAAAIFPPFLAQGYLRRRAREDAERRRVTLGR